MSEASQPPPSSTYAPSQSSAEESPEHLPSERSSDRESTAQASEAQEHEDFPFHILGLCLVLAWAAGKALDMPARQMLLGYALPIFLITQVVRRALAWLRQSDRWSRGLESIRSTLDSYGGDFYGTVTFLTFLQLEYRELEGMWKQTPDAWAFVASWSLERLFSFGIDSILNAVKAAIWPFQWLRDHGSDAWLLMALAWLLYKAAHLMLKPLLPERDPQRRPADGFTAVVDDLDLELAAFDQELAYLTDAPLTRDQPTSDESPDVRMQVSSAPFD